VTRYPEKFYAPFDPQNYELCFSCHNEAIVSAETTSTLTGADGVARFLIDPDHAAAQAALGECGP